MAVTTYNLGYLKELVKKKLQNDPYFSDLDINDAVNEAQDDLASWAHVAAEEFLQSTVGAQVEYPWPTDGLQVLGVSFDGFELVEITYEEWRQKGGENATQASSQGDSSNFYVRYRKGSQVIGLFPTPNRVVDLKIYFVPKPDDLVLDTDVPVIPRVYTQCIVYYATYKMLENDAARHKEAQYHYQKYKEKRAEHSQALSASTKRKVRNTIKR